MPLIDVLQNYRNSIVTCNNNLNIAFSTDIGNNFIYNQGQRDFIIESAYLKMFISWEHFVENAFLEYLLGEPSINGTIIRRFANPIDKGHAVKLVIGTQKYVDWANPEIIRRLSRIFFVGGNPIDNIIGSIQSDFFDLKTIRNSAAHISSTTNRELDALATRKLQRQCINYTVSQLILSFDPTATVNNQTLLSSYTTLLDVAAENIANG